MKIALVAQNATPLHPRSGSGPDHDDIGLSELTRKLASQGHQVTVYAQKNLADLPAQADLHAGVRVEHIEDELPEVLDQITEHIDNMTPHVSADLRLLRGSQKRSDPGPPDCQSHSAGSNEATTRRQDNARRADTFDCRCLLAK